MFTLLGGLLRYLFEPREFFVLILGLDNAGKTCLLEQFKTQTKSSYKGIPLEKVTPTIGLNVGRVDSRGVRLIFWDLGGQEELQELWEKYYHEAHGIVFVIDSTDKTRLRSSKESFDTVVQSKELSGVPLLVLANKQDMEGAMTVRDIKKVFNESAHLVGSRDLKVHSVSAMTGANLKEALAWMAEKVQEHTGKNLNAAS